MHGCKQNKLFHRYDVLVDRHRATNGKIPAFHDDPSNVWIPEQISMVYISITAGIVVNNCYHVCASESYCKLFYHQQSNVVWLLLGGIASETEE